MIVLAIIALLVICFVLLTQGRIGHPALPDLRGWYYAHRGLHKTGVPENSMAAFRAAKIGGYGIELDVHLMADGNLAVIHDSSLKRTVGVDVVIEDLMVEQLEQYRLENTDERIPLFSQVLELYQGEAPLIVELKTYRGNHAALCEAACNMLRDYDGVYCVESFDPRCVAWLRKNRPEVIRGQLTENFFRSKSNLPAFLKFAMKHQLFNVFTKPDFVAYCYADRNTLSNLVCRKIWGVQGVSWTIRNEEDFRQALQENWIPIFENFEP